MDFENNMTVMIVYALSMKDHYHDITTMRNGVVFKENNSAKD